MIPRLMIMLAFLVALPMAPARGASAELDGRITQYVQPYVETNNFSGAVLVARDGRVIFSRAYGFSDRERRIPNTPRTRFHVASMSMQFTAAAALRLIEAGQLSLDTTVADVIPDYPNGRNLTVRHLLTQTSGIANINDQPDYDEVLKVRQTPESLVNRVKDLPPKRPPGTYEREEHSAYNLLALIIEKKSGKPFARAVGDLVFRPLQMSDSGIDDDAPAAKVNAAIGYKPTGLYDLSPAERIHWSAKAGNASAYTTVEDELKFVSGLLGGDFLSERLRDIMFDLGSRVGYGWFKSNNERFGQPVYSMNGRSPGFASAVVYVPRERLFVAAFSNVYASVPADIAYDIGAITLGLPYEPLSLQTAAAPESLGGLPASFTFPKDFYQPNAVVRVAASDGQVMLHWPTGDVSPLIPVGPDRYIDRNYWVSVEAQRDDAGRIVQLKYDRFTGDRAR